MKIIATMHNADWPAIINRVAAVALLLAGVLLAAGLCAASSHDDPVLEGHGLSVMEWLPFEIPVSASTQRYFTKVPVIASTAASRVYSGPLLTAAGSPPDGKGDRTKKHERLGG